MDEKTKRKFGQIKWDIGKLEETIKKMGVVIEQQKKRIFEFEKTKNEVIELNRKLVDGALSVKAKIKAEMNLWIAGWFEENQKNSARWLNNHLKKHLKIFRDDDKKVYDKNVEKFTTNMALAEAEVKKIDIWVRKNYSSFVDAQNHLANRVIKLEKKMEEADKK